MMKAVIALAGVLAAAGPAAAAGFQWITLPAQEAPALHVALWYPSDTPPALSPEGPFPQVVARNAAVAGRNLPLIILSHGTTGSPLNYYDTAIALAEAGFVVAGVVHTGDNYQDQSLSFSRANFAGRPRQVSRTIDFLLHDWPGHDVLDPRRIGLLGHSAGGTTGLLAIGGRLDPAATLAYCAAHPDDWGCRNGAARGKPDAWSDPAVIDSPDPRIRAAVLAAPALGSAFLPAGLADVRVPVQLWVGARDDIVTDAAVVRTLLPQPPDWHLVADAGHFAYFAPCSAELAQLAPEICTDPPGFDRAAFLRGFQQAVIGFFRARLG